MIVRQADYEDRYKLSQRLSRAALSTYLFNMLWHTAPLPSDGRYDLVWNYAYDTSGNLTAVTPTGTTNAWRTYGYVQAGSGWYLASVVGALGNLLEQHAYARSAGCASRSRAMSARSFCRLLGRRSASCTAQIFP